MDYRRTLIFRRRNESHNLSCLPVWASLGLKKLLCLFLENKVNKTKNITIYYIPSCQRYQRNVFLLQSGGKNVTYLNFKWSKTNVLNPNGSFLKHIIVLHFIKIFINLKNESIRIQNNICKIPSCFKDYSL